MRKHNIRTLSLFQSRAISDMRLTNNSRLRLLFVRKIQFQVDEKIAIEIRDIHINLQQ